MVHARDARHPAAPPSAPARKARSRARRGRAQRPASWRKPRARSALGTRKGPSSAQVPRALLSHPNSADRSELQGLGEENAGSQADEDAGEAARVHGQPEQHDGHER